MDIRTTLCIFDAIEVGTIIQFLAASRYKKFADWLERQRGLQMGLADW